MTRKYFLDWRILVFSHVFALPLPTVPYYIDHRIKLNSSKPNWD